MKNTKKTTKARGLRSALALLLAFVFVLGVVPTGIFAEGDGGGVTSAENIVNRDSYLDYNGNMITTGTEGIVQGAFDTNFTATIPIATIFINEDQVNMSRDSRDRAQVELLVDQEVYPGFSSSQPNMGATINSAFESYQGNNFVNLDFTEFFTGRGLGYSNIRYNETTVEGPIAKFTYEGAAMIVDPTRIDEEDPFEYLDIEITYSNLSLVFQTNMTSTEWNNFMSAAPVLSLFGGNTIALCYNAAGTPSTGNRRTGIRFDVNIKIVDPNDRDTPVNGTFYFPMVDIDQQKITNTGFGTLYRASQYSNYSEQILLRNGVASEIFIPGSMGDRQSEYENNIRYKSNVIKNDDGYLIIARNASDTNTFYSGFTTLISNNNGGLDLSYCGFAGQSNNSLDTNLLTAATPINHKLMDTSGEGGSIATTTYGNHDGTLLRGEKIVNPLVVTATGQTVVCTMVPKSGYRIKTVTVHNSNTNYRADGAREVTDYVPVDDNGDGVIDYYTYTFSEIDSDNAIHVEWEPSNLKVTKSVEGLTNDEPTGEYSFNYRAELWPTDTELTHNTYKVRAWSGGETVAEEFYGFKRVGYDHLGEPHLMYDPVKQCFIGWDKENECWITRDQDPNKLIKEFDTTGFLWVTLDMPAAVADPIYGAEYNPPEDERNLLVYNVDVGVYQEGDDGPGTPIVISADGQDRMSIGNVIENYGWAYYYQPFYPTDTMLWVNDASGGYYKFTTSTSASARPEYYVLDTFTVTHSDEREYVDISSAKGPHEEAIERVNEDSDDVFSITVPATTDFNSSVLEQCLNDADIDFVGCDVIDVYDKSSVPESVSLWNATKPYNQLQLVPNENGKAYPYVYEFSLTYPDAASVEFEAIVPFGWNYKVYEIDESAETVEINEEFSSELDRHEWQLIEMTPATGKDIMDDEMPKTVAFKNKVAPSTDYLVYDFSNTQRYSVELLKPLKTENGTQAQNPTVKILSLNSEPVRQGGNNTEMDSADGTFRFAITGNDGNIDIDMLKVADEVAEVYAYLQCEEPSQNDGFEYEWRRIVLIPATNVHYEESYLYYNSDSSKNYAADWNGVVESDEGAINPVYDVSEGKMIGGGADRQSSENTLYGYDATYADKTGDSNGRSKHVEIGQAQFDAVKNQGKAWPETKFTFTGTGFDIIGRTGLNTGVYVVNVKNSANKTVKSQIINTRYFGSSWTGENGDNGNIGDDLRQVPIVHIDSYKMSGSELPLPYDTYTVTVQFVWMKGYALIPEKGAVRLPGIPEADYELIGFDGEAIKGEENAPSFDVYVDAIRIYNPADVEDPAVNAAYTAAGELDPTYKEIRDIVIESGEVGVDGSYDGAIAIDLTPHQVPRLDANGDPVVENGKPVYDFVMPQDGSFADLAEAYEKWGPNNEMYLVEGQGFAFKLEGVPSLMHISAKVPFGGSMGMTAFAIVNNSSTASVSYEIETSTEMFYDFSSLIAGAKSGDEVYIVVTASGSGILSLCELKTVASEGSVSPNIVANRMVIELAAAIIGGTKGDVNADGSIDMMDALLTVRAALGGELSAYGSYCADMNNDGIADMQDALAIMRAAFTR